MGRPKGRSKYHGMFKSGDVIGSWTVINDDLKFDKKGMGQVLSKCRCGHEALIRVNRLQKARDHNKNISCRVCAGVGEYPEAGRSVSSRTAGDVPGSYVSRMIGSARSRTLAYNLSPEYLSESFSEGSTACALSGTPISFEDRTASVDRIDSSIGYEESNTQWVHKSVNIAKGALSQDQFVAMCHLVAENNIKPIGVADFIPVKHQQRNSRRGKTTKDFFDKREKE